MSMKIVSDLKAKAIDFEAKYRIVPKVMGAAAALTVTAVPASAAEGDSAVNSAEIVNALKSGISDVITNCISVATALIPMAIGLWGLTIMIGYAKRFFTKFAGN